MQLLLVALAAWCLVSVALAVLWSVTAGSVRSRARRHALEELRFERALAREDLRPPVLTG